MQTDRTMIRRSFDHLVSLLGEELAHAHRDPGVQVSIAQSLVRWALEESDDRSLSETLDDVHGVVERVRIRAAYDALDAVRYLLREESLPVAMDLWPEALYRTWTCTLRVPQYAELACEADDTADPVCRQNLLPMVAPTNACAVRPRDAWVRPATRLLLTARDLVASLRSDRTIGL